MNRGRLAGRAVAALLLVASVAVVVSGFVAAGGGSVADVTGTGQAVAPPSNGTTVVATDSNSWLGREGEGPRATAQLFAVAPNGTVTYYQDEHTRYWDVDPVDGTDATVEYVYADHLTPEECGGESVCTRNGVERVNLTTGERTEIYSRVTPGKHSTRWHDVDRLDADHLVVADIGRDRVYVVNTTSGIVEWSWDARSEFDVRESGGPYPGDWTHLNDVEVLSDGRIMVSLRNHDQVAFLDRETGLVESWTLGEDDDHDTIHEQHNPDYIPTEDGGPAVLVADSENNRVLEYGGEETAGNVTWERTWTWSDGGLQWPRDADRLPNGHTLVTDSNGDRVLEVDESGEVVWTLDVAFPYESERLETGDESTGGPSASEANLESSTDAGANGEADDGGPLDPIRNAVSAAMDVPAANAVLYVLPAWMSRLHLAALLVAVLTTLCWVAVEAYWSAWSVSVERPWVSFERRD